MVIETLEQLNSFKQGEELKELAKREIAFYQNTKKETKTMLPFATKPTIVTDEELKKWNMIYIVSSRIAYQKHLGYWDRMIKLILKSSYEVELSEELYLDILQRLKEQPRDYKDEPDYDADLETFLLNGVKQC